MLPMSPTESIPSAAALFALPGPPYQATATKSQVPYLLKYSVILYAATMSCISGIFQSAPLYPACFAHLSQLTSSIP